MQICMLLQFCSGKVTPGGRREKKAKGGIAKGCGKVMNDRRKSYKKNINMGLRKWVSEKWVDIGTKRKRWFLCSLWKI
jgi:hypothetical protein